MLETIREAQAMDELSIRIKVEDLADFEAAEDVAAALSDVNMEAKTGAPTGGFGGQIEPVTAILIGAGVVAAAKFIVDWWDRRRGGLVVDQRPNRTDDIYRDRDVPFGLIVVFPPDGGKVNLETRDLPKDAMERLLETVISGGMATVAELATVAIKAVGPAGVRTSEAE